MMWTRPTRLLAGAVAALAIACGGAARPGSKEAKPAGGISPLPRSVLIEQDKVVVEGHWVPIAAGSEPPVVDNAVRVACERAARSCKEDLTRLADEPGGGPVHETNEYRIDEWTKWGTPAGKLVASRRQGGAQHEIRVSLSGLTAEKFAVEKGSETRWRIE